MHRKVNRFRLLKSFMLKGLLKFFIPQFAVQRSGQVSAQSHKIIVAERALHLAIPTIDITGSRHSRARI